LFLSSSILLLYTIGQPGGEDCLESILGTGKGRLAIPRNTPHFYYQKNSQDKKETVISFTRFAAGREKALFASLFLGEFNLDNQAKKNGKQKKLT
jgi:hypothetical protein